MSEVDGPKVPMHVPGVGGGGSQTHRAGGGGPGKQTLVQRSEQQSMAASQVGVPMRSGAAAASPGHAAPIPVPTGSDVAGPKRASDRQAAHGEARIARLVELLTTTEPAGVAGFDDALAYLTAMAMADMLATISGAADCGFLPALLARSGGAGAYDQARLLAAMGAVELARAAPGAVTSERLNSVGVQLEQISASEQLDVFAFLLQRRGVSLAVTALLEGVIAMRQSPAASGSPGTASADADPHGVGAGSGAGSDPELASGAGTVGPSASGVGGPPAPIGPGPWIPPGRQPIPYYIGNQAHKAIAVEYETANAADTVLSNNYPISSILARLRTMGKGGSRLSAGEPDHGLAPDIVNLTRLHLYEIKPEAAQGIGAVKASMYMGVFNKSGIAMTLGPQGAPGTMGGVPAPGGVFMFWSPQPGVIVYQHRKGRLVPVPVPEPEPVRVRRWRFELKPMTREQQQAVATTTLGGAMLIVLMLLLSPVGI